MNPGMVETEGLHAAGIAGSDFRKRVEAQTPLGRIGRPEDIARVASLLLVFGSAAAEEFDAVIDDPARAFAKQKNAPDILVYGKLTLDSAGKVVSKIYKEGQLTRATKVVMGTFDEKKKKWTRASSSRCSSVKQRIVTS